MIFLAKISNYADKNDIFHKKFVKITLFFLTKVAENRMLNLGKFPHIK
jgi:hypothetical protein